MKCRIWELSLMPKGQSYHGDKERLGRACEAGCCQVGGTGRGNRDCAPVSEMNEEEGC